MNRLLTKLMSGHQDLVDRYGLNDPLVLDLKAEIDRFQKTQQDLVSVERRQSNSLENAWSRHAEIASL